MREQFFIELVPNYDQKKKWATLENQARTLMNLFKEEIERQIEVLGVPMAKVFYMEAKSGEDLAPDIVEPARSRIKEQVYDNFRLDLTAQARKRIRRYLTIPLEINPKEVHFSVEGMNVRVPYLGLLPHKKNQHILADSDGTSWSMENITSMRLMIKNHYLGLVIDTREDPSLKTKKTPSTRRKSSKWLT